VKSSKVKSGKMLLDKKKFMISNKSSRIFWKTGQGIVNK
jgi:hypothetical protein